VVEVVNRTDGRLRFRGEIDMNRFHQNRVDPVNVAFAYGSCADCQTLAVALQLDLYERDSNFVAPRNAALSINSGCTRCVTVALALQFVIPVDDLHDVPRSVDRLVKDLDREFREIRSDERLTLAEAEARIDAVIADFIDLTENLDVKRDEAADADSSDAENRSSPDAALASPTPSPTPANPTPTMEPTPTVQPTGTHQPTPTAEPSTPTPTPSVPTPTGTATPSS
jgi:hypothetical protein